MILFAASEYVISNSGSDPERSTQRLLRRRHLFTRYFPPDGVPGARRYIFIATLALPQSFCGVFGHLSVRLNHVLKSGPGLCQSNISQPLEGTAC